MKRPLIVALATFTTLLFASASGCNASAPKKEEVPEKQTKSTGSTRRLTVDQLQASIPVVGGKDVGWLLKEGQTTVDAFDPKVLGATLGRPDYYLITSEPAQPDALYVKLMDDMARNVCNQMVKADAVEKLSENRTLVRFAKIDVTSDAAANAANIRYLMLRFLGRRVAEGDTAAIIELQALFDKLATGSAPIPAGSTRALEAWRGVCVALLSSPAFHIY
jgi:hypothetical protein